MLKTKLTIVRHGETEWNTAMRFQGIKNSHLTRFGYRQIELLAKALKNEEFDVCLCSNLQRAIETAQIINKYHRLKIIQSPDLNERNFGILEGLTWNEFMEIHPEVYENYQTDKINYCIPNGESLVQFYHRVKNIFSQIVKDYEGKKILVVTHGGVLDSLIRMIFDYPLSSLRCFSTNNAAINSIVFAEGKWILEEWGNVSHLKSLEVD